MTNLSKLKKRQHLYHRPSRSDYYSMNQIKKLILFKIYLHKVEIFTRRSLFLLSSFKFIILIISNESNSEQWLNFGKKGGDALC